MINLDDCWLYAGYTNYKDYGFVSVKRNGKWSATPSHRVMYEAYKGKIPDGLIIDHLCRVHRCCNPEHLEAVTYRENLVRGNHYMENKTHCRRGHEFTDETIYRHTNGTRICKLCRREYIKKMRKAGRIKFDAEKQRGYALKWWQKHKALKG